MKVRIDAWQKSIPIPDLSSYTFAKVMQKVKLQNISEKYAERFFIFKNKL